ncbi:DUF2938 domain-containing protein [Pseudomonas sp. SIMBA_077]
MNTLQCVTHVVAVGIGATLFMDAIAVIKKRLFAVASLDYRLVGRWLGHMLDGQIRHASIATATPIRHEAWVGWLFHYLTGLVFAALLVMTVGCTWLATPTLLAALGMGLVSIAAPWLIMQPAWGMGVAAAKTAKPWLARQRSVVTHLTFGFGLYLTAWLLRY